MIDKIQNRQFAFKMQEFLYNESRAKYQALQINYKQLFIDGLLTIDSNNQFQHNQYRNNNSHSVSWGQKSQNGAKRAGFQITIQQTENKYDKMNYIAEGFVNDKKNYI